jgi:hypothetical protein
VCWDLIAIWYKPTAPGASAAPKTVAGVLLIAIVGMAVAGLVARHRDARVGAAGLVGPRPVAHRMMTSPGLAELWLRRECVAFAAKLKLCAYWLIAGPQEESLPFGWLWLNAAGKARKRSGLGRRAPAR